MLQGNVFLNHSPYARTVRLSQMSLGTSSLRHQAISNNISNVDTPHYKRKMITFESELNRVIAKEKAPPIPFKITSTRHLPPEDPKHYYDVTSNILEEYDTNYKNDKNNVDIEKEIGDQVKNNLHYGAVTTIMTNSFGRFRSVLARA
ncbi:flagellar basal body rod protein FlgB [Spirochaetota bacterium]|nr:flagellar basal body rod protein FlgB [Spirochaetota bacterium]